MEESPAAASLRERLAAAGLELVCPSCKGPLDDHEQAYACGVCWRDYPVVAGIPDFRLLPDRFISFEDDRRKGLRALDLAKDQGGGFEAFLDAYWSITPELDPQLAARHRVHQAMEIEIGEQILREVERLIEADATEAAGGRQYSPSSRGDSAQPTTLLDLGCGTAGLLAAVGSLFGFGVGVDVAFRWLLAGRLRLREAGVDSPLVCANAEHLPFRGVFDRIVANDLLEHVVTPAQVLAECRRVVAPSGYCYLATNNRYSLAPEPHVQLWGVGFLARDLQMAYVQSARDHSYQNVNLLSGRELRRLASRANLRCSRVEPAPLFARHLGKNVERVVNVYNQLRLWPPASAFLGLLGPRVETLCRPAGQ